MIPSLPTATLADLQTKAGYVLDLANKLLVDNATGIHQTVENAQVFSMALAHNAGRVERRWRASPTSARPSGRSPTRRRFSPRTPIR